MKPKIVLFNTFNTVVPVIESVCEILDRNGYESQALTLTKQYRESKFDQRYFNLIRLPKILAKSKLLANVYYSAFAIKHAFSDRITLAIIYTQPPLLYIVLSYILSRRKIPFILGIMDFHPEMFYALGYLSKSSFIGNIVYRLAANAMAKSDHIITIGSDMKERVLEYGVEEKKISVIHVIAEESKESLDNNTTALLNQKYESLNNKLVLVYAGNLGRVHTENELISTINWVSKHGYENQCQFILISKGQKVKLVRRFVDSEGIVNVIFKDYLPQKEFDYLLKRSHIHVITLSSSMAGVSVPSKFFSSMLSGSKVIYIGPQETEIADIIRSNNLGLTIENNDMENIYNFIEPLLSGDLPPVFYPEIERLYKERYGKSVMQAKYLTLINNLVK